MVHAPPPPPLTRGSTSARATPPCRLAIDRRAHSPWRKCMQAWPAPHPAAVAPRACNHAAAATRPRGAPGKVEAAGSRASHSSGSDTPPPPPPPASRRTAAARRSPSGQRTRAAPGAAPQPQAKQACRPVGRHPGALTASREGRGSHSRSTQCAAVVGGADGGTCLTKLAPPTGLRPAQKEVPATTPGVEPGREGGCKWNRSLRIPRAMTACQNRWACPVRVSLTLHGG